MFALALVTVLTFIVIATLAFMALTTAFPGKTAVEERLEEIKRARHVSEPEIVVDVSKKSQPKWLGRVEAVSASLPLSPHTRSKYGLMLIQAGFRRPNALALFFGFKVILAAGLFAAITFYLFSTGHAPKLSLALGILGSVCGLVAPNVWLREKLKKRQREVFHSLPDVLDLMTVCVEAGLGMDAAIIKISEEEQFSTHVLAQEFRTVSQELRAGKTRIDALRDLGERTGVEDIKSLVALLIQTDKLGASLARSLRVHSDSLRTKRRQIAEEAAAKTSVKLIFPLAFFVFPALLVVLLGPAFIRIHDILLGQAVK